MSSPQQSEPPTSVSHTPGGASHVIRIQPLSMIGVVLFLFALSFPVFGWPAAFFWTPIIPIVLGWYILRIRTTVGPDGLVTRSMFGSRTIAWSDVAGLRFPRRGWARADLRDAGEAALPAVTIDDLPRLAAASGGVVPDPTPSATPTDDGGDDEDRDGDDRG